MSFSVYQILWFFFVYSCLGWCMEVVFHTATTGEWVNRGFLNGPLCPIYGCGMVIVLLVLWPLRHHILLLFLGSVLLTSTLELITGWVLKTLFHTVWWDYSRERFNLGGYICLRFSVAWGVVGVGAVLLLHPPIQALIDLIPLTLGWALLGIFSLVLLVDGIVTLVTLIGIQKYLGEIQHISQLLRRGSDAISRGLSDVTLAADERLEEGRQALPLKVAELQIRRDFLMAQLTDTRLFRAGRLLKAFPHMRSVRYGQVLTELKKRLQNTLHR